MATMEHDRWKTWNGRQNHSKVFMMGIMTAALSKCLLDYGNDNAQPWSEVDEDELYCERMPMASSSDKSPCLIMCML